MASSIEAIRSCIDSGKTVVAIALNPGKDLTPFYEGLSPLIRGLAARSCQVIFLTVEREINADAYLERQFGTGIFRYPGEKFTELDFVDVFVVFDYCSYAWRFPETAKVIALAHFQYSASAEEIVSLFGYRTDYLFLVRGSKAEWSRKLRQIEVAANRNFPHRMLKKNGCLIPGGYPEIDALIRGYRKSGGRRSISFCTTGAVNNDDTLRLYGRAILAALLESFPQHTIVFRPTPSDRQHELVLGLAREFSGNASFRLDCGDLQATLNDSDVLVSDCTGLKEVFSLVTRIPYIHADFAAIGGADRRAQLGHHVADIRAMLAAINRVLQGELLPEAVVDARLSHPGRSAEYLLENFDFILTGRKHDEWLYYENRARWPARQITKPRDYFPYIRKYMQNESMRSMSLRITDFALKDFPRSAFLWAIKARLHRCRGEHERATEALNTANRLSPREAAATMDADYFDAESAKRRIRTGVSWLASKVRRLYR